jgi:hypothetical protein
MLVFAGLYEIIGYTDQVTIGLGISHLEEQWETYVATG